MEKNSFFFRLLRSFGPGFITGAADDDPSGIGTYSQTGAMFGYGQLWMAPFSIPFMVAIQEMCGRIGMVTGKGLSSIIKEHYSRKVLSLSIAILLVANTLNIGADLGAMASSLRLLIPLPFLVLLFSMTALILFLEVRVPYPTYAKFLKYLTISLLAYVFAAFIIKQDWALVGRATIVPHIIFSKDYLLNIAAVLGTTISPYLFFWQADEEVEEEIVHHKLTAEGAGAPAVNAGDISQMRFSTTFGMIFSQITTFFIILTVASTLGAHGITSIQTAEQAALALKPLAGDLAFLLFTVGIVGTGLIAVPVLAGSGAYALAEAFGWKAGLGKRFSEARGFYWIIIAATCIGLFVNFSSVGAMTMLYYSAILNGLLAPPLMILILAIGNNKKILGVHTNSRLSNAAGAIITVIMGLIALTLLGSLLWHF